MEYCESLPVQALVHMIKAQNNLLGTEFHYLDENETLTNGSEEKQANWLEKTVSMKALKKTIN